MADKQGALALAQSLASQLQRTPAPEVLLALYHVAQVGTGRCRTSGESQTQVASAVHQPPPPATAGDVDVLRDVCLQGACALL